MVPGTRVTIKIVIDKVLVLVSVDFYTRGCVFYCIYKHYTIQISKNLIFTLLKNSNSFDLLLTEILGQH